ncbi:MAG: alpha-glucan family phosphorylase [Desulfuromonadales bacterium]|nr:alpha-glucan family phosphorylase [Desulfuromonadales bacterium]
MKPSPYLPRELPEGLAPLTDLATDLRWTWSHESDALWRMMDPEAWELTENPYVVLQNLAEGRLEELATDSVFKEHLWRLAALREEYLGHTGWFGESHGDNVLKGISYFSLEFGLGEALPLYAGGLGILAGDYLKAASDLGVPVTAVGLLYQQGYFRQVLDAFGWQQEAYPYNDPTTLPVQPVAAPSGAWLKVPVELPGRVVQCRAWLARVGRVTFYLLDTNDPLNSPIDRGITGKLYGGGQEMRLVQEIVLGVGGWRLIEALGLDVQVCHLNEGHAAFVTLERARYCMRRYKLGFREALWATRPGNLFTTHTPVAAAFDTYSRKLVGKYGQGYAEQLGISPAELAALGHRNPDDPEEPFNMAYLAARTCGAINGVSRVHGEVSRRIFQALYPRWPQAEVPVSHVTNGVHVPSWDSLWADDAWTRACGKERWRGLPEPMAESIESLSDKELWSFEVRERSDLVRYARKRLARHLAERGADPEAVAEARLVLDPNVLTLGFARRFTEYKRPTLLLHDTERLLRLLTHPERPVQLIVAGKAHPEDGSGKGFVQQWSQFVRRPEVRRRAVFLEDYDIALAQQLVQGVDVWINTPRRPWEACGTSGMKVLANGGMNLSVLDGWWAEAYSAEVGWALGNGLEYGPERDAVEALELYRLLEEEVVPMFYDRDVKGIPQAWVARMRISMAQLAPQYSSNRMVREYVEKLYLPAAAAYDRRLADGGRMAKDLFAWETLLQRRWPSIHWGKKTCREEGDTLAFEVQVYLGELPSNCVQVELYADAVAGDEPVCVKMERGAAIAGSVNGFIYGCTLAGGRPPGDYTPRIVPHHSQARTPIELNLIGWCPGV